jgi:hypothetical protein
MKVAHLHNGASLLFDSSAPDEVVQATVAKHLSENSPPARMQVLGLENILQVLEKMAQGSAELEYVVETIHNAGTAIAENGEKLTEVAKQLEELNNNTAELSITMMECTHAILKALSAPKDVVYVNGLVTQIKPVPE